MPLDYSRGAGDEPDGDMEWETLQHSKKAVNRAGLALLSRSNLSAPEFDACREVVNNWRGCHNFPLNTFQVQLRRRAKLIYPDALVAQRIKRLQSIEAKLTRFPKMTLSQMQDIGGCRAIMRTVSQVKELAHWYQTAGLGHTIARLDDYIRAPQPTGYRGMHLIFKYKSEKSPHYDNLQIEMQFRSQMQHIWATAVETVDTFSKQALKSSMGSPEWQRFFALMGSAIAEAERSPLVPDTPRGPDLVNELRELASTLDVRQRLSAFPAAVQIIEKDAKSSDHFFLLELIPDTRELDIQSFRKDESEIATAAFLETEKRIENTSSQAVLVSVNKVAWLRRAYPNYFLDSKNFLALLKSVLDGSPMRVPPLPKSKRSDADDVPPLLKKMLE